jgi:hypothetical protein
LRAESLLKKAPTDCTKARMPGRLIAAKTPLVVPLAGRHACSLWMTSSPAVITDCSGDVAVADVVVVLLLVTSLEEAESVGLKMDPTVFRAVRTLLI